MRRVERGRLTDLGTTERPDAGGTVTVCDARSAADEDVEDFCSTGTGCRDVTGHDAA
jgi:hypothetical protein